MTRTKSQTRRSTFAKTPPFATIAMVFIATATAALCFGTRMPALWAYLMCVSAATFGIYAYDKSAAARGGASRVPERTLHLLAAIGGTPAAWIAQHWLRHKTAKNCFRTKFRAIAILQIVVIAAVWYYSKRPA